MAYIEKFLGRRVEVPEDRRYYVKQGLWAKSDGKDPLYRFPHKGDCPFQS